MKYKEASALCIGQDFAKAKALHITLHHPKDEEEGVIVCMAPIRQVIHHKRVIEVNEHTVKVGQSFQPLNEECIIFPPNCETCEIAAQVAGCKPKVIQMRREDFRANKSDITT